MHFLMLWKTDSKKSWLLNVWTVPAMPVMLVLRGTGWQPCSGSYKSWLGPLLLLRSIETWQENETSVLSSPFFCCIFALELGTTLVNEC